MMRTWKMIITLLAMCLWTARSSDCAISFPAGHIVEVSSWDAQRFDYATLMTGFIEIFPDAEVSYTIVEGERGATFPDSPYILFERSTKKDCELYVELAFTQVREHSEGGAIDGVENDVLTLIEDFGEYGPASLTNSTNFELDYNKTHLF